MGKLIKLTTIEGETFIFKKKCFIMARESTLGINTRSFVYVKNIKNYTIVSEHIDRIYNLINNERL